MAGRMGAKTRSCSVDHTPLLTAPDRSWISFWRPRRPRRLDRSQALRFAHPSAICLLRWRSHKVQPRKETLMTKITYRAANVDGMKIFYREAGPTMRQRCCCFMDSRPAATCFRNLIPLLADRFHIVAPDLPGFGQSDLPSRDAFKYTFDNIAAVIGRFPGVLGLHKLRV